MADHRSPLRICGGSRGWRRTVPFYGFAAGLALLAAVRPAGGRPAAATAAVVVDRTVVRFVSQELGGAQSPRFVTARQLAFEARLEGLADRDFSQEPAGRPYLDRHIRAALERHIAETLLAAMPMAPVAREVEVERQARTARSRLIDRIGGLAALREAANAEHLGDGEILSLLRRQARASLYLDRMVAPMLQPSEAELRTVHRTVETPFKHLPFEEAAMALRRWYVMRRLSSALDAFYQGARTRIEVTILK